MKNDFLSHARALSITLPAREQWVPLATAAARKCAELKGFSLPDAQRIALAVEEAAIYAIGFGYGETDAKLSIDLAQTCHGLQIVLRSRGLPLDEAQLPHYDPERFLKEDDTTGLSPFLIHRMVDRAVFSVLPGGECEITLLKTLPVQDLQTDSTQGGALEAGDEGQACSHQIRLAVPDDAESIARLAFRAHGYVLFNEQIYYPARVREMLERREMVSVVAETAGGVLVAHSALEASEPGARAEELNYGFVDRRFQGCGIMGELTAALLENATERGVHFVTASAVTNHVKTQRIARAAGLKEAALLLALSSASQHWSKDGGAEPERITDIVFIKMLGEAVNAPLYVPEKHRAMVERIKDNIGYEGPNARAESQAIPQQHSRFCAKSNFKEGWVSIRVLEYGRDICDQARSHLKLFCAQGIPAITIQLPLKSPLTYFIGDEIEKEGFFFAGIYPGPDARWHLLLQYLNRSEPDYDAIQLYTPFARDLLAYVHACNPNISRGGQG